MACGHGISDVEVCIATYQRPYNIRDLVKQLEVQSLPGFHVNIWNNSRTKLDGFPGVFIHNSPINEGSAARFKLAKMVKGDIIIFLDDDEQINLDFIEYNYTQHKKFGENCILGWYSKVWNVEHYWMPSARPLYGQEADYIGTGGMILNKKIFDDPITQNIPEEYAQAEDLFLSALARKKGMKLISIDQKCRIVDDGLDQGLNLINYKIKAFDKLRKEGWKLLKDSRL